jgi:hypothetical protein
MLRKLLLLSLICALPFAAAQKRGEKKRATPAQSLTGCVDQKEANFILRDPQSVRQMAELHGDGFSDDNFAKHLGHRVTVTGTLNSEANPPVMKVREIKMISEICEP